MEYNNKIKNISKIIKKNKRAKMILWLKHLNQMFFKK
jgi:hypothetical protein